MENAPQHPASRIAPIADRRVAPITLGRVVALDGRTGRQGYCGANSGRTQRFQLLPGAGHSFVAARRCQLLSYLRWLPPRFLAQQHGR